MGASPWINSSASWNREAMADDSPGRQSGEHHAVPLGQIAIQTTPNEFSRDAATGCSHGRQPMD